MANYKNNFGNRNRIGNSNLNNNPGASNPVESAELSAEDYEIIAAGLAALGEVFAFLALVKAKQVTKETGGQVDIDPLLFIQSRKKKAARRKSRPPR
ncbi:hypothetical protein NST99_23840 [Paenibacillus sp. FSL L8-0470]|uniref:hypothetical protein n=1 Tax=unclassified Paenibacillus TaxID=185978 RepID=UPI0030F6F2C5